MTRTKRRIGITAGILTALLLALLLAGEFFLHYALHHERGEFDAEAAFVHHKKEYPWAATWTDSIRTNGALRDTCIMDEEGQKMHAWYLPAPVRTGNTAVIVHGYTSNAIEMMQIGYMYHHALHWNILLPDLLAHGLSDGETIQMGWKDRHAVRQWIDVAHKVFSSDTMIVHGISMGAATTMCVAGDPTPDYVRGFVEDCGYTSVWDEFESEQKKQFGLPTFPLLHVTSALCKLHYGWSFGEASPLRQIARCHKPMLFIHGDNDGYVPTAMVYRLYDAKQADKELWLGRGSAHAVSYQDHPEEYTATVQKFLDRYVLKKYTPKPRLYLMAPR